jgi:hypothetical protein
MPQRKLWEHGDPFDFEGEYLKVEQARLVAVPDPAPQIYFGGSSAAAGPVAAARSDVYLTWGEPPAAVAEKIAWIRKLAADAGRTIRFGIRLHVITRDTSEDLEIYPNLWAGVGLARGGAGTALVGSHEEVADRIKEYADLGIEEFILSGYPHLEEAYWFGESSPAWNATTSGGTRQARPPCQRHSAFRRLNPAGLFLLFVGARALGPGGLLGWADDDELVAGCQYRDGRVVVAVDLAVAND